MFLCGSYARGDYDEESDIDVMVRVKLTQQELKSYERKLIHLASDLSLEHNITVSLNIQDSELFEQYKDDLPFSPHRQKDKKTKLNTEKHTLNFDSPRRVFL